MRTVDEGRLGRVFVRREVARRQGLLDPRSTPFTPFSIFPAVNVVKPRDFGGVARTSDLVDLGGQQRQMNARTERINSFARSLTSFPFARFTGSCGSP